MDNWLVPDWLIFVSGFACGIVGTLLGIANAKYEP